MLRCILRSPPKLSLRPVNLRCLFCQQRSSFPRRFTTTTRLGSKDGRTQDKGPFRSRLRAALHNTKIEWGPIPVGLGFAVLGAVQFYRVWERERKKQKREEEQDDLRADERGESGRESHSRPRRRGRIKPSGPWQVQVMSTLPLKAVSRVWGRFNELEIPYYLRVPGFKLYSWIFGVNLSEVSEPDLHVYPNLASFFYRTLKPGARPLDVNASALLSPADGRVLQFGIIEHGEVEQVKGMTYSLDALLGSKLPGEGEGQELLTGTGERKSLDQSESSVQIGDRDVIKADEEFANMNGIPYTLPSLLSGPQIKDKTTSIDASTTPKSASEAEVRADLALGDGSSRSWFSSNSPKNPTALYYLVIYLAPGDYHRFHSPTSWVAEKRRHFAGELYSVSPYLQRMLPGLFTLNERVVLLGRWRWGFFSFTPVGATNVGSIKINFDAELRTNSLTTDTAADRAAEEAALRGEPYSGFAEATYAQASKVLGGHALRRGEEMGGFQLGSSIVLVFEAPEKGGWRWGVEKGQKVKVGEAVGWVDE
ncbi:phosphatidylserine decarboxylase 1 [Lobaria immixta]|nr:phosphatidylserine decarboxylase 1 [Lobaria immixta]